MVIEFAFEVELITSGQYNFNKGIFSPLLSDFHAFLNIFIQWE
jgi:hypothetical protein